MKNQIKVLFLVLSVATTACGGASKQDHRHFVSGSTDRSGTDDGNSIDVARMAPGELGGFTLTAPKYSATDAKTIFGIAVHIEGSGPDFSASFSQDFQLGEDLRISDLHPGKYHVKVDVLKKCPPPPKNQQLFDCEGVSFEQGETTVNVVAGKTEIAIVSLKNIEQPIQVAKEGSLSVVIQRPGH